VLLTIRFFEVAKLSGYDKYPEDEDRDGLRNLGFFTAQPFDLADSPRELHHRFLEVAKFSTLTPLSLLASCRLSLPIIGLKMSSLPTFALKSHSRIFIWNLGN
jgi:hypothetical protein